MPTAPSLLLYSSTNSSLAPFGPRNRSSLITIESLTLVWRPVPESAAAVDPPLLLVTVSVAVAAPAAVGVNVMGTVVNAPAASVVAAGGPAENCDEPVTANGGSNVTEKPLVFVIVTDDEAGEPTTTTPKLKLGGVDVSVAATMAMVKDDSPEQPLASVARIVTG